MLAANGGHHSVVEILLKRKANPNVAADDGCTALLCAVQGGYVDCIEEMLKHKTDVNFSIGADIPTPLYTASQEGHAGIVKMLLKAKAEMDRKVDGVTPLFIASQEAHKGCVSALLHDGADCNMENKEHTSPLFIAAQKGHSVICGKLLANSRIKIDDANNEGTTPLLIAIQMGNHEEVGLLVNASADLELADKDGQTPLLTAASYGDMDVIQILIKNGVDLQQKDSKGRTAYVILKEEFGEDLAKIAAESRLTGGLHVMPKINRPTHVKAKPRMGPTNRLHERVTKKARKFFDQYDTNGDETLGRKELLQCLTSMGCEEKLGAENFDVLMNHTFARFDKDKDGTLGFDEFLRLYTILMSHYKKLKHDKKREEAKKKETNLTTVEIKFTGTGKQPIASKEGGHSAPPLGNGPADPPKQNGEKRYYLHNTSATGAAAATAAPSIQKKKRCYNSNIVYKISKKPSQAVRSANASDGLKLPPIGNKNRDRSKEIRW